MGALLEKHHDPAKTQQLQDLDFGSYGIISSVVAASATLEVLAS